MEDSHALVVLFLRAEELQVARAELFMFNGFVGEGFHHTDTGQGILQACVDSGNFAAVVHKDGAHLFVLPYAEHEHHKSDGEQNQRHRHVDPEQQSERTENFEQGNEDVLRSMMSQLADIKEIRDKLAHHLAGVVSVVIREGETLILIKKILTHIAFHARAHDVSLTGNVIPPSEANKIHQQQAEGQRGQNTQNLIRAAGKNASRQIIEKLRECKIDHAYQHGAGHIDPENGLIGFVVAKKFFQNVHLTSLPARGIPPRRFRPSPLPFFHPRAGDPYGCGGQRRFGRTPRCRK